MTECGHDCNHEDSLCVTRVPVFSHLSHEELVAIQEFVRSRHYRAGDTLHWAGDVPEHLAVVASGLVKAYRISKDGKEQIVQLLAAGDFFGELALFGEEKLSATYEAIQPTTVCFLHRADISSPLEDRPSIALKFLRELSQRLSTAQTIIELMGLHSVEERLVHLLVQLAQAGGQRCENGWKLQLQLTRGEMAAYLGTSTETVSRRLHSLEGRGLLSLDGPRTIIIPDLAALENG